MLGFIKPQIGPFCSLHWALLSPTLSFARPEQPEAITSSNFLLPEPGLNPKGRVHYYKPLSEPGLGLFDLSPTQAQTPLAPAECWAWLQQSTPALLLFLLVWVMIGNFIALPLQV